MTGIFVKRGMTISVPPGGLTLTIGDDARVTGSLTLHVHFDVCPTWIDLSLRHLGAARAARVVRDCAWSGTDDEAKSEAMEREFESSMQAIVAVAIAIDAFYAVLRRHVSLPPSTLAAWRTNGTARYVQITEVIRRAFRLKNVGTASLRSNLKELQRYRDMAVHPPAQIQEAIIHPELNVGVEWRFVYYRTENAELAVNAMVATLWELCNKGTPANDDIAEYAATIKARLTELLPGGPPVTRTAAPRN